MNRSMACAVAAVLLAGVVPSATAAPTKAKKLTAGRAAALVEKKVKADYRKRIDGRAVSAGCERTRGGRFACDYRVDLNAKEQRVVDRAMAKAEKANRKRVREGKPPLNYLSAPPVKYEGTGTVSRRRGGDLVVRISRPR